MKKACKKLGVPCTGKKDVLKERISLHILNNSTMAAINPPCDDEKDMSFHVESSAMKQVNFDVGELDVDPEFRPVEKATESTKGIKKKLWETDEDDAVNDEVKNARPPMPQAAQSKRPPKTPSKKMTPSKRKKSRSPSTDSVAEKENTPKRMRMPLGFGSSSPRPLSSHNAKAQSRTPVHMKQT